MATKSKKKPVTKGKPRSKGGKKPKPDAFISYSSADKDWVRGELLSRIEEAGLKAFIDFRDFEPAAPILSECERGVIESRKTLLVLTPEYHDSEWGEFENVIAGTLDPASRKRRVIPLLKKKCKMPLRIAALTYVDFTDGADLELAWRQLLTALGAPPEAEDVKTPARDDWFLAHPYPMPPNFTGRVAEREMLSGWLNGDAGHPLLSLRALGGFGKSALAWHWLMNDVDFHKWPRVVWWSFYEGDSSFDHFLAETVHYLSRGRIKPGTLSPKEALIAVLDALHAPGTLLVLDGFERVLRAFGGLDAAYKGDDPDGNSHSDRDCISPLAETFLYNVALLPGLKSKVLLTTRLCPRILEAKGGRFLAGCAEKELTEMQPEDAVAFFHAEGIRGTRAEIERVCARYGYHPLSLRLLAGWIVGDFEQPGDISAANRLDAMGSLVQRQHHVLEAAYESLAPGRKVLLGRIACFRSPVKYEVLKALAETERSPFEGGQGGCEEQRQITQHPAESALTSGAEQNRSPFEGGEGGCKEQQTSQHPPQSPFKGGLLAGGLSGGLDGDLRDLVSRGLLHYDAAERRFDLHPIVRRYSYDRLAGKERDAEHVRLRDYFSAVPEVAKVTSLDDLAPVVELYHHTVRAGQYDEAITLFRDRINQATYFQFGAYQLIIDLLRPLFVDGEDRPPRLKKESDQAWALNELANSYSRSGQPRRAVPLYEAQNRLQEKLGNKKNVAIGLGNLANKLLVIGSFRAAEANLRRSIALCREISSEFQEAVGHEELGRPLSYRGAYDESDAELDVALKVFEEQKDAQSQCIVWAYRALRELLLVRSLADSARLHIAQVSDTPLHTSEPRSASPHSAIRNPQSAISAARRALELADEWARTRYPMERDYVRAHWLLGAAYRAAGETVDAEKHLHEALERCRRINLVEFEADILIDLARLRADTGAAEEARRLAAEALVIADRSGYVMQGADAHLELAKLAFARGEEEQALEHAREAKRLATCDGPPEYTYKAAYDEAGRIAECGVKGIADCGMRNAECGLRGKRVPGLGFRAP